jgi:hypothetical protein
LLLSGRRPTPLRTPSLLVSASAVVPGMPPDARASRSVPHTRVDVPGDHHSMLQQQQVVATASAVREWAAVLGGLL